MNLLHDHGIIDRTPVDNHPQGCDWRTADDGREIAHAISETWTDVLGAADRGEGGQ